MAAAQAALVERGLPATRYHEETFVFEDLARDLSPLGAHHDGASSPGSEVPGYEVTFRRSSRTITCRPDQFVLDAALEAGLTLPSSCGLGMCGTCKTTLLEGTVDMSHQGGIRQREIDNGKVLICCSRPTSPLVIDS
jgi:ferredoxin